MIPREYRDVRLALAWGVVMGVGFVVGVPAFQPEQVGFASDVYYVAAEAVLAGENPYLASAPETGAGFIYPPVTLLAFLPHALTGSFLGAYLLQLAVNVATAAALLVLVFRTIRLLDAGPLDRIDRFLVGGFVLASVHAATNYVMGQVNLQLALAVAAGIVLVEREMGERSAGDRDGAWAGVAFALAAAVKLFPAALGAWLLRLRRFRAVATAIAAGLLATAAGVLLVGVDTMGTYLTGVLPAESKTAEFAGGLPADAMYVTIRRPIAALLPNVDPGLYALLGILVLAPFVLASYRDVSTPTGRLTAAMATILATILALPFEAYYFSLVYVPLVPLLYALPAGRVRRLMAAGTVLLSTLVSYEPLTVWVGAAPLPAGVETAILAAARTVLGVAQPPLIGGLCVLTACALWHHRSVRGRVAG